MGLLARIVSVVAGAVFRAGVLLAVLFGVHLLISTALPRLQETARALERGPEVEARLEAVEQALRLESESGRQFAQRLEGLTQQRLRELRDEVERWRGRLQELESERDRLAQQIDELRRERDEYCASYNPLERWACRKVTQRFENVSQRLQPLIDAAETNIERARKAIDASRDELAVLQDPTLTPEQKLERLDDETASALRLQLEAARGKVAQAKEDAGALRQELRQIRQLEQSRAGWLLREWNTVKYRLLLIVLLVLGMPYVQRVVSYFVLMPLVTRLSRPLRLVTGDGRLEFGQARRSLRVELAPTERACFRAEYARPVRGKTRSLVLYDWQAPLISYASGLRLLTQIDGAAAGAEVTLAAPGDPNSYLMRIELHSHPGIVIHPRHLVGVVGAPELRTRWRLFSLHAWATWQLRYILFSGDGSIVVEGLGDVVATVAGEPHSKIEQNLVIGFDATLEMTTRRTEAFLPYLLGKTPLVDDAFRGPGAYLWEKSTASGKKSVLARSFDAVFSALGKLLGF